MPKALTLDSLRILYVSMATAHHASYYTAGVLGAFNKLGVARSFPYRSLAQEHGVPRMNELLIETIQEFQPNLIFLRKCESVYGATIKTIKDVLDTYIIYFCGDFRLSPVPFIVDIGRHADCTVFNNEDKDVARAYLDAGVKRIGLWWDGGVDPDIFYPRKLDKAWDLAFMGTNVPLPHAGYKARRELLERAVRASYSLQIFGGVKSWEYLNIPIRPYVAGPAFAEACSRSRITLGINGVNDAYLYASWQRTFKSMASGAFHLTHYVPGMETFFENHKHLVWFKSVDEAMELIKYYLKHEAERQMIASLGRREILAHFTWDDSIERLMKIYRGKSCLQS